MKKLSKNKPLTLALSLFFLSSSAYGGGEFADIFTDKIYDQSKILAKLQPKIDSGILTDEQVDDILVDALSKAKMQLLAKKRLDIIKNKIKKFGDDEDRNVENKIWTEMLNDITNPICWTRTAEDSMILLLFLPLKMLAKATINNNFPVKSAKISELEAEIEDLIAGLENEAIKNIEIKYVKSKRKIPNDQLRKEIEKTLLKKRKQTPFEDAENSFLEFALKLPHTIKPLLDIKTPNKSRRELLDRFKRDKCFSTYGEELREQLEAIVTQTAIDSMAKDNIPCRKTYFFYGDPGTGKTSGAKKIPKFLDLPYFKMTVHAANEFSQQNVEGVASNWQNPNPGWLVKPFFEKTKNEKERYKNAFLIIDDIHTILSQPTTLAYLLDYLDPDKKKFENAFFRAKIDIGHLNIIMTSNEDIEDSPSFQALKSRIFKFVYFGKNKKIKSASTYHIPDVLPKEDINSLINEVRNRHYVSDMLHFEHNLSSLSVVYNEEENKTYDISQEVLDEFFKQLTPPLVKRYDFDRRRTQEYRDNPALIDQTQYFILPIGNSEKSKEGGDIRLLKHQLDDVINRFRNELDKKGGKWITQARLNLPLNRDKAIKLYKMAILAGHEDAFYEMAKAYEAINRTLAFTCYMKGTERGSKESARECANYFEKNKFPEFALKLHEKALFLGSDESENWVCNYLEKQQSDLNELQKHLVALLQKNPQSIKLAQILHTLGDKFANGGPSEYKKAYDCFNVAINHGYEDARKALRQLEKKEKQEKDAIEEKQLNFLNINQLRQKATQGNESAAYKLGLHFRDFRDGRGTGLIVWSADDKQAIEWFTKAAEKGHAGALYQLGRVYENHALELIYNFPPGLSHALYAIGYVGDVCTWKDDKKGIEYYRKAAEKGHSGAQYQLGYRYLIGKGSVAQDYDKASEWLNKAAAQGHRYAQDELKKMRSMGLNVSPQPQKNLSISPEKVKCKQKTNLSIGQEPKEKELFHIYQEGFSPQLQGAVKTPLRKEKQKQEMNPKMDQWSQKNTPLHNDQAGLLQQSKEAVKISQRKENQTQDSNLNVNKKFKEKDALLNYQEPFLEEKIASYKYTSTDISRLIRIKFLESLKEKDIDAFNAIDDVLVMYKPEKGNKYVLYPVDKYGSQDPYKTLIEILENVLNSDHIINKSQNNSAGVNKPQTEIIIPFNPGRHWVTLRFIINDKEIQLEYIDSLNNIVDTINQTRVKEIENNLKKLKFNGYELKYKIFNARIQCDNISCGVLVVENIIDLINGKSPAKESLSEDQIQDLKKKHQDLLKSKKFDFDA